MTKTPFFLGIVFTVVLFLSSCTPAATQNPNMGCGAGYTWNASYQNADGSVGACVYTGGTTTTTGGTTTVVGGGTTNGALVAVNMQAYADLDHDGWADLAGANTLAGGTTDMSWRIIYFSPDGVTLAPAIVDIYTLNRINLNLGWNAVANIWQPRNGAGHVVFVTMTDPNGYQMGSTAAGSYQNHTTSTGVSISQQPCTGNSIYYRVTDYNIVQ